MPSKDYIVRFFEPGEEEAIIEVLKTCYPDWRDAKSPLDHWKWKYIDNPLQMTSIVVGIVNDEIIGCDHPSSREQRARQYMPYCPLLTMLLCVIWPLASL